MDMRESDESLVERLQGALRVVGVTLDDATPEVLDRFRRDEWRFEVSVEGIHILQRRRDAAAAAGETLAAETEAFLREGRKGNDDDK